MENIISPIETASINSSNNTSPIENKPHWGTILLISIGVIWIGTRAADVWKNMKQLKRENSDQRKEINDLKSELFNAKSVKNTTHW